MTRLAAALLIIIPTVLHAQSAPMPALTARQIGPIGFAGRVADVAMDPRAAGTFYVAFASGGVYRTVNDGNTFDAIFDSAPVAGIGAMAVSPADPRVLWIGTGEATDRNDVSWGDGVYRSTDGGATWTNVGLAGTRFIARIVPHPTDPNTAWVAAPGNLWAASSERGCYLTTDGGATWRRMLAAPAPYDTVAGCGDVAVDPRDPRTVYAALYARRRTPWSFAAGPEATGGRDVGGIFRSRDGGATWTRLGGGLPANTGRIALAVAPSNPRVVYAQVQSEEPGAPPRSAANSPHGGVFRSNDGGDTWVRTSAMNPRPFYFSQLRVDPADENTIYLPGFVLLVSHDSGRSWSGGDTQVVHEDLHALAIDPRNPERLLLGSDGGPYLSRDGGAHWEFLARMQTAQVYRLNVDDGRPYRVCVGTQDNGNWIGSSATRSADGITARDWRYVHGGDGADCFFDAREPRIVMTQSGTGWVTRVDLRSGAVAQPLTPKAEDGSPPPRFEWTTPMLASRWDADAFYLAGNRVFRGTRRGDSYRAISPDLSAGIAARAGGTGAETYGTVYALAESPLRRGMLWAATDDGKLWVTEDAGAAWSDLSARLPAEARGGFLASVEAGHADARVAYLAMDAHRTGDFRPHLWRTADRGRSWMRITGNLPADAPVKVVREDPANPDVLYAGTEHGLYTTVDGGRTWAAIGGLPAVPVDALVLHPRELDLVVGTHGRGVYVIDDVRPLAQLTPAVRAQAAHLFPILPATAFVPLPGWTERAGDGVLRGANPLPGALITYWIRPGAAADSARLTVTDSAGRVVATLAGPGTPGLNRVSWDLGVQAPFGATSRVLPGGEYTVTLAAGGVRQSQTVRVEVAPGLEPPPE